MYPRHGTISVMGLGPPLCLAALHLEVTDAIRGVSRETGRTPIGYLPQARRARTARSTLSSWHPAGTSLLTDEFHVELTG